LTKIIGESDAGGQDGVTLALLCEEVRGWFDGVPVEQRFVHTELPGLTFIRFCHPTEMGRGLLSPSLCLVLQGSKKILLGKAFTAYGGGSYLLSTLDMPISGQVAEATPATPYLGLRIELDVREIAALIIDMGIEVVPRGAETTGAFVDKSDAELRDAFLRLVRLLKKPEDSAVLLPLVKREIFYRLLKAKSGSVLYQAVVSHANDRGVHQAILWIKDHFKEPMRVDTLAKLANMSASVLHRRFKEMTVMSPLQYQKHLRLLEARKLLLDGSLDAASAAFSVGYQSPSQFSREYRRYFGISPLRDREGLKSREADYE
jgi:AraC-like DNA-binding protein